MTFHFNPNQKAWSSAKSPQMDEVMRAYFDKLNGAAKKANQAPRSEAKQAAATKRQTQSVDLKILDGCREFVMTTPSGPEPGKHSRLTLAVNLRMILDRAKIDEFEWISIIPVRRLVVGGGYSVNGIT